jgi:hypothetical protein
MIGQPPIEDLEADVEELKRLISLTERESVKNFLNGEVFKL